ncbi:hypothetical protein [Paenibacillus sp. HB172176]|uniref:hypothetical protein n=1 Tax=Paenibacillus sp. HB172176 TaxID=2493690 RepID=UPI0014399274|nr:hypothetical protein [Paenibacillus sp. HB172176]
MQDAGAEGRDSYDMDIDRMVNEGLGGGNVTLHNGLIAESTTDTMEPDVPDAPHVEDSEAAEGGER